VAGVSLDRRDNDPVVLVPYLAAALDRVEPVDPGLFPVLASPGGSVVPQLVSSVVAMTEPVTVVLDQLESLENRVCLDALAELALGLPAGSQLLLGSRRAPALPVALLRAQGMGWRSGRPSWPWTRPRAGPCWRRPGPACPMRVARRRVSPPSGDAQPRRCGDHGLVGMDERRQP
jgi:hypothetical protein